MTMFFEALQQYRDNVALVDVAVGPNEQLTFIKTSYSELQIQIDTKQRGLREHFASEAGNKQRFLVLLQMHMTTSSVIDYLALLQSGIIAILIDPDINQERLEQLSEAFQPNGVMSLGNLDVLHTTPKDIDPNLAIMLPTSGSTGAAKYVCLSIENLASNSASICDYLPITADDRAIASLPLFYSYGLSILNTHLNRGASLYLHPYSIVNKAFWQIVEQAGITSFAGVPSHYEMLNRLRFRAKHYPSLRYLTQAGGKLDVSLVTAFAEYANSHNILFFVMYGQTEATARITFLAPRKVLAKPSSIGQPIKGGEIRLVDGEIHYRGPNVMLGYASRISEMNNFQQAEWLETGDLAEQDSDGDLFIKGRLKRFTKLQGNRIDLDQLERLLRTQSVESYCVGDDQKLTVATANRPDELADDAQLKSWLHKKVGLHPAFIKIVNLDALPLTPNGKKDYPAIATIAQREL